MSQSEQVSGHVFRREGARGPVWYAKYRLADGRQIQKRIGPAWTQRGRRQMATSPSVWRSRSQLELAIIEWAAWFNNDRLHESLGDLSPAEFETLSQSSYGPTISMTSRLGTN